MNVLVYAQRGGSTENEEIGDWLQAVANGDAAFGISTLVLSGLIRVVTHPRVFERPTPLADAIDFATSLRARENCVELAPGERHWSIFTRLCAATGAVGNAAPDAYFAALAIESGSEWITTDRGFARFRDLRWRHPLS
ncbi:MAG: TA system VapC family ribonuclease toxin [Solirubrobacteraceae bacterium]